MPLERLQTCSVKKAEKVPPLEHERLRVSHILLTGNTRVFMPCMPTQPRCWMTSLTEQAANCRATFSWCLSPFPLCTVYNPRSISKHTATHTKTFTPSSNNAQREMSWGYGGCRARLICSLALEFKQNERTGVRRGNACRALESLSRRERQIKKKHPTVKYVVLAPKLLKENIWTLVTLSSGPKPRMTMRNSTRKADIHVKKRKSIQLLDGKGCRNQQKVGFFTCQLVKFMK